MSNTATSKLRGDEEFVIQAVAASVSGEWKPAENPPDAYLYARGTTIAVEISRLTQYVTDENGGYKPRLSEDATAIRLCEELNRELSKKIPKGRTVHLTLSAPIASARRLKPQLGQVIIELIETTGVADVTVEKEILGNQITIHLIPADRLSGKQLVGLVTNQKSHVDILANAKHILADRIAVKTEKCRSLDFNGPVWLALYNDYRLADANTYMQALDQLSLKHKFERILLVEGNRTVRTLYEKHNIRFQATQKQHT
ncbi:MAG TPA: hypothetical protein ENJ86_01355 [Methylothermaceae bacterium]|nr:hypothetical protein [Methylothermaceae bacterium]